MDALSTFVDIESQADFLEYFNLIPSENKDKDFYLTFPVLANLSYFTNNPEDFFIDAQLAELAFNENRNALDGFIYTPEIRRKLWDFLIEWFTEHLQLSMEKVNPTAKFILLRLAEGYIFSLRDKVSLIRPRYSGFNKENLREFSRYSIRYFPELMTFAVGALNEISEVELNSSETYREIFSGTLNFSRSMTLLNPSGFAGEFQSHWWLPPKTIYILLRAGQLGLDGLDLDTAAEIMGVAR